MIEALIGGETNPAKLASLADVGLVVGLDTDWYHRAGPPYIGSYPLIAPGWMLTTAALDTAWAKKRYSSGSSSPAAIASSTL
jgi:hypothetical protein